MAKLDCKAQGQLGDQEKLQAWLESAINQNLGRFNVH
jgi:hypothetical protein